MKYKKCKVHENCRKVVGSGEMLEFVRCPFCGAEVGTGNTFKWCSVCYTKFKVEEGYVHFSPTFEKKEAEKWAVAFSKAGGIGFGNIKK